MLSDERRMELSDVLRPVAPPREIDNVYTDDQRERLLNVVHTRGPWRLIIAQHFASADELMATMSGAFPEGFTPSLDLFHADVPRLPRQLWHRAVPGTTRLLLQRRLP